MSNRFTLINEKDKLVQQESQIQGEIDSLKGQKEQLLSKKAEYEQFISVMDTVCSLRLDGVLGDLEEVVNYDLVNYYTGEGIETERSTLIGMAIQPLESIRAQLWKARQEAQMKLKQAISDYNNAVKEYGNKCRQRTELRKDIAKKDDEIEKAHEDGVGPIGEWLEGLIKQK